MAFLKVFGSGEERTVFLGDAPIVVGRGEETDLRILDLKISRQHCSIEPLGGGRWQVRDLKSGNGTRVNGVAVEERPLRPDDVIELGDIKILFAGEAASVVPPERPASAPPAPRRGARLPVGVVVAAVVLLAAALALKFGGGGGSGPAGPDPLEQAAWRAVQEATTDAERLAAAELYLKRHAGSARSERVGEQAAQARVALARAGDPARPSPFESFPELAGLDHVAAIARLRERLPGEPEERRDAMRAALRDLEAELHARREAQFAELEALFDADVAQGEYLRAYQMWFYLRGDWGAVPDAFLSRIVAAMERLENAASAERARLFEEVALLEAAHDFARARELLAQAKPRLEKTAVVRSLDERLEFLDKALAGGATGAPVRPASHVGKETARKVEEILLLLPRREFAGAASALRALAAGVSDERARVEVEARAEECEAAASLLAAVAEALAEGKLPPGQLGAGKERWRITSGDAQGLVAVAKGEERRFAWADAPGELLCALLDRHAGEGVTPLLGWAVAAHSTGAQELLLAALARGYASDEARTVLDRFVGARVRKEPPAQGGYMVAGSEILSRQEHLRRVEEATIARFRGQLESSLAKIRTDKSFARLEKLREKKEALDKARAFALDLIFDEKKYFYPYRGTGREGEYQKVQQEVDQRVAAVVALWDDATLTMIAAGPELERELKRFDEAVVELGKRLVEVAEPVEEVGWLRSYLGRKFDVRNFYRTPEERELLEHCAEVMEDNRQVAGDVKPVEREQVEITNRYRLLFGRRAVRLVEKLVLSSRGHCEEMARLDYFGHFSPTPGRRTPYDRMMLQGYEYGASENCIMGQTNAIGAHTGWCHSSGHHRNLLMPMWTEMGTGAFGIYMTQNFGQAPIQRRDPTHTPTDPSLPGGEEPGGGFRYDDDE
ncbi:MAG: FHA domain-containing protein [Planctomycetaceae bacterium]